jgi:hypothetical protein
LQEKADDEAEGATETVIKKAQQIKEKRKISLKRSTFCVQRTQETNKKTSKTNKKII